LVNCFLLEFLKGLFYSPSVATTDPVSHPSLTCLMEAKVLQCSIL